MIVVSGSSGFIGAHLLESLPNSQGVSLRAEGWRSAFADARVVINLVGKAHDHAGTATEEDYFYANVELAKKVFRAFLDSPVRLLIHVSSIAAVEEFESASPLVEASTCRPSSWYGKTKRQAEEWLLAQPLPAEKKVIILRPPMVHGPGDKGNLGLLYKLISKGIPYPLAAYHNWRSFISIDNFNFFIQEIIKNHELLPSGIYHISDDESVSTTELIQLIGEVTHKNVRQLKVPKVLVRTLASLGDVLPLPINSNRLRKMTSTLEVSNRHLKELLGIDALPVTAKDGLRETIKSF